MPLHQNDYDCGIFVCQYIQALVEACFEGAENGVRFRVSPLAYRRGLREDVCAHAEGRLIGELTAAGHEIPPGNEIRKPPEPEVIGDEVEDREWRAEMAARMHRLEVRNEGQAVAIAKLERQLRELMLSRTSQHGVDGEVAGEGHGDVAGAGGTGEPAPVEVMGGDNAGTHDSNPGAHGEGPVAAVETSEGGKARDEGAGGLLGTTDGNRGAREAVGTGHGVTASNVDVDLVSAYSTGIETTSRNTARGRAPSSGCTGISTREAAHICRPSISSSKMVQLSVEERRRLEGLTSQGVERIVDAKRWAEWRNWHEVLSSLPEPSTPVPAGVHTQAPPLLSHQHPGATFGNYHPPAAAFAGHAGATLNSGGWQPYTHRHPPPNLHFPSQQFAFNQIPIHPFSQKGDIRRWFGKKTSTPVSEAEKKETDVVPATSASPLKSPSSSILRKGSHAPTPTKTSEPLKKPERASALQKASAAKDEPKRGVKAVKSSSTPSKKPRKRSMIVDDDEDDEEDDNEDDADFVVGKDSGSHDADEEDEDEADEEEEEEEEQPAGKRKRGKAGPTTKKATPSKPQPASAAEAKDTGGRGRGGGGGRGGGDSGGGRGGGGGRGRGWGGRVGFFGERSAPPHKGEKEVPEGPENALTGITFVISGTLDSLEREDAEDLIKRHGGRITGSVSGKTTYLLADEDIGGRKSTKAKELGVKFLTEDGLFDLIRAAAKKQKSAPAKSPPAKQLLVADKGRPADDHKPDADRLPKKLKADPSAGARGLASQTNAGAARPVVAPTAAARSGPVEVESWPQKYAPKSTADIIANQGLVKQLHDWLSGWEARHLGQGGSKKGKKGGKGGAGGGGAAGGDMNKKAVLLSGGPGIGKTTTARLVCAALGFSPLEVNASDSRGKSDSKIRNGMGGTTSNTIKEMISNTTLRFSPVPTTTKGKQQQQVDRAALIMDEVDGMSGGDRGGVADLIASIKESRVPIICICNDRYSQKLKSLVNHCLLLNYRKPTRQQMAKRLRQVANAEKIQIADNALEELAERTGGDMRLALNQLQYMSLSCRQLSYQEVKQRMQANAKDEDIRPMAAADTLMGYGARGKRLDILVDAAMSDIDLMPLFIQENYLNHVPGNDPSSHLLLSRLSQAADAISSGDLVNVQVRRYQQWQHLQFAAVMSCITPGLMVSGRRVTLLEGERNFNRFPGWLGKNSSVGKNYRLLDDLHQHLLSSHLLPNPSRQVVRLDYLEPLVSSLTQPLHKHAQDGVETVVEEMMEYGLTLDDLETAVELSHFKGRSGPMEGVPAPVKARLTREFKKEQQAHKAKSAATLPPLQLPGGRGKAGGRGKTAKPSGGGGTDEASLLQADTDLPVAVDEVGTLQEDDDDAAEDASSEHDEDDEAVRLRLVGKSAGNSSKGPTKGGKGRGSGGRARKGAS
ncbi:unnamed protein product [Closterium sp. NIES-53]